MIKLLYQPTTVKVSSKAATRAVGLYGEGYASLMLEALKSLETKHAKPNGFMNKLLYKLSPKTKLTLHVDVTPKDEFVITAKRKVGIDEFSGSKEIFPLTSTLTTMQYLNKAVQKSKETILEKIIAFSQRCAEQRIKTF